MQRTKIAAFCNYVRDGDTFRTLDGVWIRLANVCAPEMGTYGWSAAKRLLESLILNKWIAYDKVGTSYGRTVAEVWVDGVNVNSYMRRQGYICS